MLPSFAPPFQNWILLHPGHWLWTDWDLGASSGFRGVDPTLYASLALILALNPYLRGITTFRISCRNRAASWIDAGLMSWGTSGRRASAKFSRLALEPLFFPEG